MRAFDPSATFAAANPSPQRCRSHLTAAALAVVFHVLYIARMSRSATLPPIRVEPKTKASLEAVLREGESLTQFIENAVCREAQFRTEQNAAVARAKKALRNADKGAGLMTAEDFLAGMEQRAKDAQRRIREAVAARNKRAPG
jgi:hypothetical protein